MLEELRALPPAEERADVVPSAALALAAGVLVGSGAVLLWSLVGRRRASVPIVSDWADDVRPDDLAG